MHDACSELQFWPLLRFQWLRCSPCCETRKAKFGLVHGIDDADKDVTLLLGSSFHLGIDLPVTENSPQMPHVAITGSCMVIDALGIANGTLELVANCTLSMC